MPLLYGLSDVFYIMTAQCIITDSGDNVGIPDLVQHTPSKYKNDHGKNIH